MAHNAIASKDFSRKTLSNLSRKGIAVIASHAVPAFDGDRYFSGVAYALNDNGAHKIRRHGEVMALAA